MKGLLTMKRTISLILSAAAAVLMATSCSANRTISRIKHNGALNVGYVSCAPSEDAPFVMENDIGLTAEPAAQAGKSLDVGVQFTRLHTDEAYEWLLDGNVDCLWNVISPEKSIASSVRTIETGIYYRQLVITVTDSDISRLADVSGKVMAVVSGSDAQTELHNASVMESSLREIQQYDSMQEVLTALTEGKADCAAVDEPQALYWIAESGDEFKLIDTPIAENQLVIATREEDSELCSRIAESYVKMAQAGEIKALCAKYTGGNELNMSMQNYSETV